MACTPDCKRTSTLFNRTVANSFKVRQALCMASQPAGRAKPGPASEQLQREGLPFQPVPPVSREVSALSLQTPPVSVFPDASSPSLMPNEYNSNYCHLVKLAFSQKTASDSACAD
ncbi:hypothetical protein I79_003147 [Cricetulus griseus]|uniref:Uncharacterized protein n=1 Tax=Cricetulus griseus TaxID=10029 RepID=G3GZ65_CRIGR|nr:hypothetical protein I79_003147 [Cricetulus griseus]